MSGRVLFELVRHWARRSAAGEVGDEQGRHVLVCEAAHGLAMRGAVASVNAIAHEIGLDQSGASRLVKAATAVGYLEVSTSAADGRRREVSVTPAGRRMLEQAHLWQEEVFLSLTSGWSDTRRRELARSLSDLLSRSRELDA